MEEFLGRPIRVRSEGLVKRPVAFRLDDLDYQIEEILDEWQDWGFGKSDRHRTWRTRHHRNYYRVRTAAGDIFEIYCDRPKPDRITWYASRRLSGPSSA